MRARQVQPDGTPVYFMGRCGPDCKTVARIAGVWWNGEPAIETRWSNPISGAADAHGFLEGPMVARFGQQWHLVPFCIEHRSPITFVRIRATRGTACDSACARSTAKDCRCSCGGANHGASA
jgi:hypothetical protein